MKELKVNYKAQGESLWLGTMALTFCSDNQANILANNAALN
ncbi:hypothetical protein [Undibacterium sp. Tian12W]